MDTPGVLMLEERADIACIWDIRVDKAHRGKGIGTQLFSAVSSLSRIRKAALLKVETQNTNVPACRFYQARGMTLGAVNRYAYGSEDNSEVQLYYYLKL